MSRLFPQRPTLLAALTTLGVLGQSALNTGAQAVTFAGLNITPRGEQKLNLETGATELPQGGTAVDSGSGMKLVASRMQLRPGQSLIAQNATLTTRQGGTLKAAQVTYDLKGGTVVASGGATYHDSRFEALSAPGMALYLKSGFVTAGGGVKAQRPALNASGLVFDPNTMQVLLTGPAQVSQSGVRANTAAGGRLVMVFGGSRLLRATSTPDNVTLARFRPYLK
ncbi:hypothetical protein [Deinococcus navajonensis]|uniref:Lipopolysaccharide export system protein LptA n=1 Tax=Deinococcus navajonensis TaxID=309884 RepID=A0ABV8XMD5_9DEIO